MGGNLTIFDKDHDTAEEGRSGGLPEVKFLQPSTGVRYDCSRARVPKRNNIFLEGGWKLVMHITVFNWRFPSKSLATLIFFYYSYYILSLYFSIKAIRFR
jgi:hypothetical protein